MNIFSETYRNLGNLSMSEAVVRKIDTPPYKPCNNQIVSNI